MAYIAWMRNGDDKRRHASLGYFKIFEEFEIFKKELFSIFTIITFSRILRKDISLYVELPNLL